MVNREFTVLRVSAGSVSSKNLQSRIVSSVAVSVFSAFSLLGIAYGFRLGKNSVSR